MKGVCGQHSENKILINSIVAIELNDHTGLDIIMLTMSKLIKSLSHEEYVSGQLLAERFAVTRATINNHITCLQQLGVQIECIPGRGYRLQHPLQLHDVEHIKTSLAPTVAQCMRELHCEQELESTNTSIKNYELPPKHHFSVLIAERQTAGRGRRGRTWISPYAANITLSLLWNWQAGMQNVGPLSPFLAIQLAQMLAKLGLSEVKVKWPNDIYCADKKIAGLLIECSGEANANCRLVIGLGLNVFMSRQLLDQAIDQAWTDVITQHPAITLDRDQIAAACIEALVTGLQDYESQSYETFGDGLCEQWSEWDWLANKTVRVDSETNSVHGVAMGITDSGGLRLVTQEGEQEIVVGEVSVREANARETSARETSARDTSARE